MPARGGRDAPIQPLERADVYRCAGVPGNPPRLPAACRLSKHLWLHIHVAVPIETDRAQVMNVARWYLPHLLALTASSPYYLGATPGTPYRTILWRRWPRTGAPLRFSDEKEFQQLLRLLLDTKRIDGPGRLYWDLRPHHEYRTLEFRIADVTLRIDDAMVAAALARG